MSEMTYSSVVLIPGKEREDDIFTVDMTWDEFVKATFKTVAHWLASVYLLNADTMILVSDDGAAIEYRKVIEK